jgi:Zn-dependent protease with chaperone function
VRRLILLVALTTLTACATVPDNAYYPNPTAPETRLLAQALYRAARAASEDPQRYSFAILRTAEVRAYTADEATFYFSQGLALQAPAVIDALIAHEIAHALLDHVGRRRPLSASVTSGLNVLDFFASSLVVRAYTRDQEIEADQRAVEVLRDMGYTTPRRALAHALREAAARNDAADGGRPAMDADLRDRLAALEPLEPVSRTR